ncbi:MAG TPA: bacteriohemerythrin [Gallionella sp.]|nr:bacteriohemerythrin [Gallionella sp.]
MDKLVWTAALDTGIGVIDKQHRRIVDCINQLHDAHVNGHDREQISNVIDELVDYTLSHFSFEEAMQDEAKYPFCKAHKRVHETFANRVKDYQARFAQGEDVCKELHVLLVTWLFNHITREDADYVEDVKAVLQREEREEKKHGFFARIFL